MNMDFKKDEKKWIYYSQDFFLKFLVLTVVDHRQQTRLCVFIPLNSWEETGKPLKNDPLKMRSKDMVFEKICYF